MEKAIWFYKKDEEKNGPVSHDELQSLLDRGIIDSSTKIWTDSLANWLPISEVEHFNLSSLDETPMITVEKKVEYNRETDQDYVRPRPWVRFWARMVDYSLFFLVIGFLTSYFGVPIAAIQPFFGMVILFLWVFVEAAFLSTWGKTPGKWILRVSVRTSQHQKLSYSDGLNRSFSVWWLGMGAAIPIVFLITMIVAAVKLSNTGSTSWDRRSKYRIFHGKIGTVRTLIVILYFLCYFWFISRGQMQLMQYP